MIKSVLHTILPGVTINWLRAKRQYLSVFLATRLARKDSDRKAKFGKIYQNSLWGVAESGDFFSGPGSTSLYTNEYEEMISRFISDMRIQSVLDIGCGDFQVSGRLLSRTERTVKYIGVDVVDRLIERNNKKFGTADRIFRCIDAVEEDLPPADLVLVREVLQHLSVNSVTAILRKLAFYRYVIVTEHCAVNPKTDNVDIPDGRYARVDLDSGTFLDKPPFNIAGSEILRVALPDGTTYIRSYLVERDVA